MRTTIIFILMYLFTFNLTWSQEKKGETPKNKEKTLNWAVIKEVKPVPEAFKVGFDSINGQEGLAYLQFLASDSLEGRETATPGYQVAAEFVATLFNSWGLKPAGDMPDVSEMRRSPAADETKKTIIGERRFCNKWH